MYYEFEEKRYHEICQRVLRKHYAEFRKDIADSFFIDCEERAEKRLMDMIRAFRMEMDILAPERNKNTDLELKQQMILSHYMKIARKYGNRAKRKLFS